MASLNSWFKMRPSSAPTAPVPARGNNVVAAALSRDGFVDLRVLRRADGTYTYQIEAWTNFEDAGGNPHCQWHSFEPSAGTIAATFEVAADEAIREAKVYGIEIDENALRPNKSLERTREG